MVSTDELMASKGVWFSGEQSVVMIESLMSAISSQEIKLVYSKMIHREF
jgi:hypothetical protein